jgi:mRNA interferase MazF
MPKATLRYRTSGTRRAPTVLTERPEVARGEVWFVALDPTEQAKTRPCVVVQRDAANRQARTTVVVPLTDATGQHASIVKPLLPAGEGGLRKDSLALCHQIRTVDRLRLVRKTGTLGKDALHAVGVGLVQILDLDSEPPVL